MAFHKIKIGSNNFTLAPQQVKPTTSSTDTNYPIPFLSGLGASDALTARTVYTDTANELNYNPSTNALTGGKLLHLIDSAGNAGKGAGIWLQRGGQNDGTYDWQMWIDSGALKFSYNNTSWYDVFSSNGKNLTMHSGSIITPQNDNEGILPATNNYGQIGSETKKFYRMYASTFYGALSGNASTASKLQTARNIKLTEAVVGDANFDGSANITITTHLPNKTATATTAGWYRIAATSSGVFRSTRIFQIDASIAGQHTVCTLIANTNYNALLSNGIQVLSCSHFGSGGITKARLVYESTGAYSGKYVYLEVYVAKANTTLNVRSSEGFGWTLSDIAAGSIPSGYTSKEVTLSNNTMVSGTFKGALDGNATSATNATKILLATQSTSGNYPIVFGPVGSASSTSIQNLYVDTGLNYNPNTNVLTTTGHINATNGFYETSDEQLKDFQEDIEVNFSYLHNIPKKYYSWKDDATYTRHIGTSAQEVQKYYPELVNTDDDGYLTMNYDKLSVVALKAIDVLHEEVTELKKENAELKERLARLEELILNNR